VTWRDYEIVCVFNEVAVCLGESTQKPAQERKERFKSKGLYLLELNYAIFFGS